MKWMDSAEWRCLWIKFNKKEGLEWWLGGDGPNRFEALSPMNRFEALSPMGGRCPRWGAIPTQWTASLFCKGGKPFPLGEGMGYRWATCEVKGYERIESI